VVSGLKLDPFGLDLLKVKRYVIQKMLAYDPTTRITAKAALSHPYFKDFKDVN
jgi:hypothetical protein